MRPIITAFPWRANYRMSAIRGDAKRDYVKVLAYISAAPNCKAAVSGLSNALAFVVL